MRRPAAALRASLLCPLCKDVLRIAVTAVPCLHSFCRECVDRVLDPQQDTSCPQCSVRLGKEPWKNGKIKFDRAKSSISHSLFPREGDAELIRREDERAAALRAELEASRPKPKPSSGRANNTSYGDELKRPRPRLGVDEEEDEDDEDEDMEIDDGYEAAPPEAAAAPPWRTDGPQAVARTAPATEATAEFELLPASPAEPFGGMWTHPFYRVSPRMPVHKFAETVAQRIKVDPRKMRVEILLAGALLPRHRTVGEAMAMASQHERVRAGNKPLLTFRVVPTAPRQQQQQGGAGRAAAGGGARSRAAPQPARAASAATAASEEQPDAPPSVPQLRANAAVMRIVRKVRTDPTSLGTSLQQLAAADRPAFNLIQDNQEGFRYLLKYGGETDEDV